MTDAEIAATDGLEDWRILLRTLQATFRASSFGDGARLVQRIAEAADRADHHPDLELRYPGTVHVTLTTHATAGLTSLDVALAREISELARSVGAHAEPGIAAAVEIAIDTMDADRIRPFWAAVLGYRTADDGSLVDPRHAGPPVWFQDMDEPRTERNRVHIDVTVPHDVAEQRVADTIAAGGVLLTDEYARSFWVLADVDGNEACVCTWQDRQPS